MKKKYYALYSNGGWWSESRGAFSGELFVTLYETESIAKEEVSSGRIPSNYLIELKTIYKTK